MNRYEEMVDIIQRKARNMTFLSKYLGVKPDTVKRYLSTIKKETGISVKESPSGMFYISPVKNKFKTFEIKGSTVFMVSDMHIPYMCQDSWASVLSHAKEYTKPTLVLGGDTLDCERISKFHHNHPTIPLEQEINMAIVMFEDALSVFDQIYVIRWNHDERMSRSIGVSYDKMLSLAVDEFGRKIKAVDIDHMFFVDTIGERWRVCHPRKFSLIRGRLGNFIAETYH